MVLSTYFHAGYDNPSNPMGKPDRRSMASEALQEETMLHQSE